MSSATRNSSTIADALDRAKSNPTGDIPTQANQVLEQAVVDTWRRIREKPDTYEMTVQEYSVMNLFNERHRDDPVYKKAVGRYWKKRHNSTNALVNGPGGSSSGSK